MIELNEFIQSIIESKKDRQNLIQSLYNTSQTSLTSFKQYYPTSESICIKKKNKAVKTDLLKSDLLNVKQNKVYQYLKQSKKIKVKRLINLINVLNYKSSSKLYNDLNYLESIGLIKKDKYKNGWIITII